MSFLKNLNWRYATKKFDKTKKVNEEDIQKIRDAIRLTPTSKNLQLFLVVEVESLDMRQKMMEASFNQEQIISSDRVFVFCARDDSKNRLDDMFNYMSGGDFGMRNTKFLNYENSTISILEKKAKAEILDWSARQAYLALGFAIAACAELKVDSCPMEGFDKDKLREVLGLSNEFTPVVYLSVGYRDTQDKSLEFPKWRFPENKIFRKI